MLNENKIYIGKKRGKTRDTWENRAYHVARGYKNNGFTNRRALQSWVSLYPTMIPLPRFCFIPNLGITVARAFVMEEPQKSHTASQTSDLSWSCGEICVLIHPCFLKTSREMAELCTHGC